MIRLIVDEYCENCPEFYTDVKKTHVYTDELQITNTVIMCEHRDRCKCIKDMIQKEKVRYEKDDICN